MAGKVALVRCDSYLPGEIERSAAKALALLGGMERFVKPGARVLIKPNMLSARPPEDAITTHPEVVRAVIRMARAAGGIPAVGDSHGGSHHRMEEVYKRTGIGKICDEENAEKLVFDRFRKLEGIPFALDVLEAGAVISVPKFKTHSLTVLTGGIKNMFGAVPGLFKTKCHMDAPSPGAFAKLLVKVYSLCPPALTILDGVTAMEGEGPGSAGIPRSMGLIAAADDAACLDETLCLIMGADPGKVPLLREAKKLIPRAKGFETRGERWQDFRKEDFKLPSATFIHKMPNALLRPAASLLRTFPAVDRDKCVLCGICAENCPAGAIKKQKGGLTVNRRECILCLCCLEFCPHEAVGAGRNFFFRLFNR